MPTESQEIRYLKNSDKYAQTHKERSAFVNASAFRRYFNSTTTQK